MYDSYPLLTLKPGWSRELARVEAEYNIYSFEQQIPFNSEIKSRYLSIDPHFSFIVLIKDSIWCSELADWLLKYIGENHKNWEWWWSTDLQSYSFEFKNEEDKVKFILRWL